MKKYQAIALAVAALWTAAWAFRQARSNAVEPAGMTKQAAPAWELPDVNGKTLRSAEFKGQVVLLDFWATWCAPCRAEIPGLIALRTKYQKQGLAVVGVSVDQAGPKAVKAFVKEEGLNYPVALADDKIAAAYGGIEGLPTLFVIDRSGRIAGRHLGFATKEEIESEIKPLLAK